ncbi:hypothetical protein [Paraburkholderia sp. Ac-20347]|uniref:hypothetical protein n=1 Tax=Paraburkholderia sp. Ac-20347 TaxID=2703892 RepID=UPI0019800823|nr:hypothetical protein [Paraburkholderia sp. Ac-20347]MBN3808221.1 hypothetical protein [Paraburkholderia sp. Ac-20347]
MRTTIFAAAALALCAHFASEACAESAGATVIASAAPSASPSAVYPPLPSLAMLPPSNNDDEESPAPTHSARKKKASRVRDCHCTMPAPRLVVSDTSRAYLKDVERQLDVALAH